MFWGLILKANKKYTQTLERPFHLSQAALDYSSSDDQPIQVMYSHEDSSYLLCTLQKGKVMQCALDLNFAEGDKLCFLSRGNGIVHLTGYLVPEEDFNYGELDSEEEEESEIETSDLREKLNKKNGKDIKTTKPKQEKKVEESEEEDESDEDVEISGVNDNDDESEEDEDEEDDEDIDDDEEDESEEEIAPPKKQKFDQQQLDKNKKQQNGAVTNGQEKTKHKDKQEKPEKPGTMQKLQGGLMYQELEVGKGGEAKAGKKVQVFYVGRLKNNNKIFDQAKPSGPGFKFILGRGKVIKGWDIGITGMKVGGKRRLICPPHLAYGHKGNPPVIPPNSTLVFDVELRNVF